MLESEPFEMANSYSAVEPWTTRISGAFALARAGENEALTRALQISLSGDSSSFPAAVAASSLLHHLPATDLESPSTRRRKTLPCSPSGKVSKRKSRPSKQTPTTYINADPANFRQMVQQVTGVHLGDAGLPVEPVIKPDPQRPAVGRAVLPPSCLPTLDTSAFLLDGPGAALDGSPFGFDAFASFPTLES